MLSKQILSPQVCLLSSFPILNLGDKDTGKDDAKELEKNKAQVNTEA